MKRLPYEFDLLYDIKYTEQLEIVLRGEPFAYEVDLVDLEESMVKHKIPFPIWYERCTSPDFPTVVWIDKNGGYITYPPEESEKDQYKRMRSFC